MLIQNSPYGPTNSGKKNGLNNGNIHQDKQTNGKGKVNDFSLWNWVKSTINPIQNLPIISGIYSSMNSDDKNSDRDMVQNSLGGFIYGGPFGALAGFGNWVFNKIFDKTPSELALDLTGLSRFWKSDVSANDKKKESDDNNLVSPMFVGLNPKINRKKKNTTAKNNEFLEIKNQNKISLADNKKKNMSDSTIDLLIKDGAQKKFNNVVTVGKIDESSIKSEHNVLPKPNNNSPKSPSKTDETYRSLNFNYPQWNSENNKNLNKSKIKSYDFNDKLNIEKRYLNIDA